MLGRLSAWLDRWNKQDKTGMLLCGMALLFGLLLPLIIYTVIGLLSASTPNVTRVLLLQQIQGILLDLTFAAFYAGLFFGILRRVTWWKNLLMVLAPFLAETIYLTVTEWEVLMLTPEMNINADVLRGFFYVGVAANLITPLLWVGVAYLLRLVPVKAKWLNLVLCILFAVWRVLPDLLTPDANAALYGQSLGSYIALSVVVFGLIVAVGFYIHNAAEKEMTRGAEETWKTNNA